MIKNGKKTFKKKCKNGKQWSTTVNTVKNGQIWLENGQKRSHTFKNRQTWLKTVNNCQKGHKG